MKLPFSQTSTQTQDRGSVITMVIILFAVTGVSAVLYLSTRQAMDGHIKENLRSTVAMASHFFEGEEIDRIRGAQDLHTAFYADMVERLQVIRDNDPTIRFAYLIRRTERPMILEFVADADSLNSFEEQDENSDGQIDVSEMNTIPGDTYDITDFTAMHEQAFLGPTTDQEFTTDQWGTFISGYAPIMRADGSVAGILGLDIEASTFQGLTSAVFSPVLFVLLVVLAMVLALFVQTVLHARRIRGQLQIEQERANMLELIMHQLGEPLTMIKWSLESLEDDKGFAACLQDDSHQLLAQMHIGTTWLDRILGAFVHADRAGAGALAFKAEHIPVLSAVQEVEQDLKDVLVKSNQQLQADVSQDICVYCDPKALAGILRELIVNAHSYSPDGTVITVDALPHGKNAIRITVRDEGYGIPKKDLSRIFMRFVRGSNAARHKPTGNGLGLYVVKSIVEHSGGRIWLESEEDKGTRVTVELPKG